MSFWDSLLSFFGLPRPRRRRSFALDADISRVIDSLAAWERRPPDEMAGRLVAEALEQRRVTEESVVVWQAFSPREQEVAALVCLGYTGSQIAARLGISPTTVKSHARNLLEKSGVENRDQLRQLFQGWDFDNWA
jgi:DNA-binding NarL/FixJ family response regulator